MGYQTIVSIEAGASPKHCGLLAQANGNETWPRLRCSMHKEPVFTRRDRTVANLLVPSPSDAKLCPSALSR